MKLFKDIHEHLLKHPCKYIGLAVFCKIMLLGLLAVPILQTIQHAYAGGRTITASAGLNGTINPSGAVLVGHGTDNSFTITPDNHYGISAITVDGVPQVSLAAEYTFNNVTANHTINVDFAMLPPFQNIISSVICPRLNLTFNTSDNTSIINSLSPSDNFFIEGKKYSFTADGSTTIYTDLGSSFPDGSYTLDIAANTKRNNVLDIYPHSVPFTVDCQPNTVDISAGANGTTDPAPGTTTVNQGDSKIITFLPDPGYIVDTATIDQFSILPAPTPASYTFTDITEPRSISVTFKAATLIIVGGGRITDKCCLGNKTPGANKECKDNSGNPYDGTCLAPDEQSCLNDIAKCLELPQKAKALQAINDQFINGFQNLFGSPSTAASQTTNVTSDSSLTNLLQRMAGKLKSLNNNFVKTVIGP